MNASQKKAFYYHADANALGGVLEHPVARTISTPSSISLAPAGGFGSARIGNFDVEGLVSCGAAQVSVSGIEHAEGGGWRTLATATIEGLNILEVVTADRIVAQVSVMHPADDSPSETSSPRLEVHQPAVNGESVTPIMDRRVLVGRPTDGQGADASVKGRGNGVPFSDLLWVAEEQFVAWKESGVEKPGPRFAMAGPEADLVRKGSALCSLVRGVEVEAPARAYCHVINIPDFGNIFLGEMLVSRFSVQLTMLRVEMGSLGGGPVTVGTVGSNGSTSP